MSTKDLRASVLAARRAAVPIVLISTPDQWAIEASIRALLAEHNAVERTRAVKKELERPADLSWDCVRGLVGLNDDGKAVVASLGDEKAVLGMTRPLVGCLIAAHKFPRLSTLFVHNAHRFISSTGDPSAAVSQALSNLRDPFKEVKRTVFLLGPQFDIPAELQPEVVLLEDPLPDDVALGKMVSETYDAVDLAQPDAATLAKAVDSGRGLAAFTAEQVYAMSIEKRGIDLDRAWERKASIVNRPGTGLKLFRGGPTFEALGGLHAAKELGRRLFAGPAAPDLIVRVEEIEKTWASGMSGGETSGTATYAFGRILTEMEEQGHDGMIGVGLGGSGKSAFANALAATFGVPRCDMDVGQTRGKYVGDSEAGIENLLRMLRHIGRRVFFVATCNRIEALPPELLRRFKKQPWYFDVPTPEERFSIWPIHLKTYGFGELDPVEVDTRCRAIGWTGAEIRNCCETAWSLAIPLEVAATDYVVPVSRSNPKALEDLRGAARDRFLSASYAGTYSDSKTAGAAESTTKRRQIEKE